MLPFINRRKRWMLQNDNVMISNHARRSLTGRGLARLGACAVGGPGRDADEGENDRKIEGIEKEKKRKRDKNTKRDWTGLETRPTVLLVIR